MTKKEFLSATIIIALAITPIYFSHIVVLGATPPTPNHLSAYPSSDRGINLSWNASSGVSGYVVYRNYSSTIGFVPIHSKITNTNYTDNDPNLMEGVRYSYKVTAINAHGESDPSIAVSATPYTPITTQNIGVAFVVSTAIVMGLIFIVYAIVLRARKGEKSKAVENKDLPKSSSAELDEIKNEKDEQHDDILKSWQFWNIIRGDDWYPSLSLFQLFLWTVVIVFAFLFMAIIMLQHGISPPVKSLNTPMLLTLLGISVGSPIISNSISSAKYASSNPGKPPKPLYQFSTMLEEGKKPSITRFQMFIWTWIAIIVFFISITNTINSDLNSISQLNVPDVDPVLVALMGISQAAYLGGKSVSKTPSIGGIYPRVISNDQLQKNGDQLVSIFGNGFGNSVPRGTVWIGDKYFEYPGDNGTDGKRKILGWEDDRIDLRISKEDYPVPGSYYVRIAAPEALLKYDKPFEIKNGL